MNEVVALVGRLKELNLIRGCLEAKRNVLLEGPVGVGKTYLALAAIRELGLPVFRIDGDQRYSEQKLAGWFDPPLVMKKGFHLDAFLPGPLTQAMQAGGVLFINELNRLPEGVQNILLPAIDERIVTIPRLGEIKAHENFLVIATQNPKEFVATSHLSEAILDRFELIYLDYQSEEEESQILESKWNLQKKSGDVQKLAYCSVKLARLTREDQRVKRGASLRASLSMTAIGERFLMQGLEFAEALETAAFLSLPTRIELEAAMDLPGERNYDIHSLIREWIQMILYPDSVVKKKS